MILTSFICERLTARAKSDALNEITLPLSADFAIEFCSAMQLRAGERSSPLFSPCEQEARDSRAIKNSIKREIDLLSLPRE